jgi:FtsP/CotA-like multicopper oxidase with cupredoxin domain
VNVEPRRYRLRVVLATDSIFFGFNLSGGLRMTQIGNDAGFLPAPASLSTLNLAPGERADLVVDFTSSKGRNVVLRGNGGDVLQFRVGNTVTGTDTTVDPLTLNLAPFDQGPVVCNPACPVRKVSLAGTLLGTVNATNTAAIPKLWDSPTTETPHCSDTQTCLNSAATEEWDIWNFGGEAHPIHLHEVQFQVLDRVSTTTGVVTPPTAGERGRKDTVVVKGHSITRIKVKFDLGGLYAWHCHMTSHEDDEMMRAVCITDSAHPTCHPQ